MSEAVLTGCGILKCVNRQRVFESAAAEIPSDASQNILGPLDTITAHSH